MNLLLDTHVLLWWLDAPEQFDPSVVALIGDRRNRIQISVASLWELAIKAALGKLVIREDLMSAVESNGFSVLPVLASHAFGVEHLPHHHKDPFDRLLVAQAMHEGLILVSRDSWARAYPVATVSA